MVQTSPWKDVLHAGPPPKMSYAIFAMAVAFISITFWLILEVDISTLRHFKTRRGLYFWSLLISSWGVFFHTLGYMTQWWVPQLPWWITTCFILFGWSALITFQSLVLYSRLHLVILNHHILRAVLVLIITTAITIQIPQWVTTWGATVNVYSVTKYWSPIDSIMVRISQMAFLIQESILSALYIWGATTMLSPNASIKVKRVMWELIAVSTFLIIMDIVILVLAYTNEHIPKEPVQNFSYALKLKLEFIILNQLLAVLHRNSASGSGAGHGSNRYLNDSRKVSAPLDPPSFGSRNPASGEVPTTGAAERNVGEKYAVSALASPTSPGKPVPMRETGDGAWRTLSDDSSGDSFNVAARRRQERDGYHAGLRGDGGGITASTAEEGPWVRKDVTVVRT